jgi:hypothetical protein
VVTPRITWKVMMSRIDVYTDVNGDHVQLLLDGVPTSSRLFTSRSLDPAHPAVWLDGRRVYGVSLHWNGAYQFSIPEEAVESLPQPTSGAETTAS